jgi:hypothetical protein
MSNMLKIASASSRSSTNGRSEDKGGSIGAGSSGRIKGAKGDSTVRMYT